MTAFLTAEVAAAKPLPSDLVTGQVQNLAVHDAPKALPDPVFRDEQGNETGFAAFRGKALMVNLWATWCGPCRHEMPSIARLQALRGGDDFQVVAISVDRAGAAKARGFLDEVGADNLDLYIDQTTRIGRALGAFGLPVTLLVDRQGREVARLVGPAEWDSPEALALVDALIAAPADQ